MAANYLEQLVAEWYQFQGYFVRQNVLVGRRPNGGYECELDVVAFHPTKKHIVHLEPSMDCNRWDVRERRFDKKFKAGRKYIPEIFMGFELPPVIEQKALLVYASKKNHTTLAGAEILLVPELLGEIIKKVAALDLSSNAIPEHFAILRTIQFLGKYKKRVEEFLNQ